MGDADAAGAAPAGAVDPPAAGVGPRPGAGAARRARSRRSTAGLCPADAPGEIPSSAAIICVVVALHAERPHAHAAGAVLGALGHVVQPVLTLVERLVPLPAAW